MICTCLKSITLKPFKYKILIFNFSFKNLNYHMTLNVMITPKRYFYISIKRNAITDYYIHYFYFT